MDTTTYTMPAGYDVEREETSGCWQGVAYCKTLEEARRIRDGRAAAEPRRNFRVWSHPDGHAVE